jgi:hypothetical protein
LQVAPGVAKDLPAERVNGSDESATGSPCALPQLCRRLRVVCERTNRRGFDRPIVEEMAETGSERPGLAGPGGSDDPSRSRGVVGGGGLVGSESPIDQLLSRYRLEASQRHGLSVHGGIARVDRPPGPAVDPCGGSVGQEDVGGTSFGGSDRCGLDRPPPLEFSAPTVVAVGPHKEVEPFEGEEESGTDLVGTAALDLGKTESGGIDTEFDDDTFPARPGPMKTVDRRIRIGERRLIDEYERRPFPRFGNGCA